MPFVPVIPLLTESMKIGGGRRFNSFKRLHDGELSILAYSTVLNAVGGVKTLGIDTSFLLQKISRVDGMVYIVGLDPMASA